MYLCALTLPCNSWHTWETLMELCLSGSHAGLMHQVLLLPVAMQCFRGLEHGTMLSSQGSNKDGRGEAKLLRNPFYIDCMHWYMHPLLGSSRVQAVLPHSVLRSCALKRSQEHPLRSNQQPATRPLHLHATSARHTLAHAIIRSAPSTWESSAESANHFCSHRHLSSDASCKRPALSTRGGNLPCTTS